MHPPQRNLASKRPCPKHRRRKKTELPLNAHDPASMSSALCTLIPPPLFFPNPPFLPHPHPQNSLASNPLPAPLPLKSPFPNPSYPPLILTISRFFPATAKCSAVLPSSFSGSMLLYVLSCPYLWPLTSRLLIRRERQLIRKLPCSAKRHADAVSQTASICHLARTIDRRTDS